MPTTLQLLADQQRWQLLQELARSDRRVGELTAIVGKPQNLVSYHLAELKAAGLVTARRSSFDGRDTYYRVDLDRCAAALTAAGAALHPGLRLSLPNEPAPQPSKSTKPRILFLCTGNSGRSQIAEALLHARSSGTIGARSAGSHPKPLHPMAVRVMAERGIDIAGQSSKHLNRFARSRFDHVITLCDKVREVCPDFRGAPATIHWSMPDPAAPADAAATADDKAASYAAFTDAADEIETRVRWLIASYTDRSARAH